MTTPRDNTPQTADDCPAVRIGIRVCSNGDKPRESFGVVTSGIRSKSVAGYLMLRSPPGAATAQVFSGLSRIWTVARGAIVPCRRLSATLTKAIRLAGRTRCPSLTSRGRMLTDGVDSLIRDSNDERRVGRRYGTRMKFMTIDLNTGMPSPVVPRWGRSKESACLSGILS